MKFELFEVQIIEPPFILTSSNISCVEVLFPIRDINNLDFTHHKITPPERLVHMVPKRRSEYLAGRLCAKLALNRIGKKNQVDRDNSGCPSWPNGTVGSISHTNNRAIACVSSTNASNALGIDVEELLSDSVAKNVAPQLLTDFDKVYLNVLPFNYFVTLVFSAKEALYKALYPDVGSFFGFDAAGLVELDECVARFELQYDLSKQWQKGDVVDVQYKQSESMIYTFVQIK